MIPEWLAVTSACIAVAFVACVGTWGLVTAARGLLRERRHRRIVRHWPVERIDE